MSPTASRTTRRPSNLLIGAGVALIAIVAVLLIWRPWSGGTESTPTADTDEVVGAAPFVLGEEGSSDATLVEFLDFQCPACASVKPAIDEARGELEGEVTFVVRMFPLDVHANAMPAAQAAVAADAQGEFEGMYDQLFAGQAEWSALSDPLPIYLEYADTLGLDIGQFEADYASSETLDRIEADRQAGEDLQVSSTPTFFLDGEQFVPESYEDLVESLRASAGS